jgi:NADH:ubiquinone oxidoreductase subunit 3 (subunit A)
MDSFVPYLVAIVPTIVVAIFFYVIIKRMIEGDRRERLAQSRFEAEEDRRRSAAESAVENTGNAAGDESAPAPRDTDAADENRG